MTAELTQEWNDLEIAAAAKEAQANGETPATATDTTTTTTTSTTTSTDASSTTVITTDDVELVAVVEPIVTITKEDLLKLAKDIVVFYMAHNAEADACDLLMEIEHVDMILDYVEKDTYQRVCLYLLG